ncbi:histone H2B-like [Carcharodon carcharias]|uniref:histone H2B-like n=1 Tax=Carcharodon carcharias TaxID=13397 RepID=UPI001B7E20E8|nr:histone H2B-like [Carcharodon carcharias]
MAAPVKGGVSRKASKQSLAKVAKKLPKKRRKSRKQSYSALGAYPGPPFHQDRVQDYQCHELVHCRLFECLISEASHLIHYKHHTISARENQSTVHLMLLGELAKHNASEGTKVVTKYIKSIYINNINNRR